MDDISKTFAECKLENHDTNIEQTSTKSNEELVDVQEDQLPGKPNEQTDRKSEDDHLKTPENQKLCKTSNQGTTKSNKEKQDTNDQITSNEGLQKIHNVKQGENIIEKLKKKFIEAIEVNIQLMESPTKIMSTGDELFQVLQDEVFVGENFAHPVTHLYEGKLTNKSDIDQFLHLWGEYQFLILQRLKLCLQLLQTKTDKKFICKKIYRSLIEMFGNCSDKVEGLVLEILKKIFLTFPCSNKELLNICQYNLIDYNLGLRSSTGVDATLQLVHYILKVNPFIFKPDFKLYNKVILILFKNVESNFANTLQLFILDCLSFYDLNGQMWGKTFQNLFKYWKVAPKEKSELYAELLANFLTDLPPEALVSVIQVNKTLAFYIFDEMQSILKHSKGVTFETRIAIRGSLLERGFAEFLKPNYPWIYNYFFKPQSNTEITSDKLNNHQSSKISKFSSSLLQ